MKKQLLINGTSLNIQDILNFVYNDSFRIAIAGAAMKDIEMSRAFLEKEMATRVIYGTNTGFGPMASHKISNAHAESLQENLVLSHAVGMGPSIPKEFILAAMLVRLDTLVKGYSAVTPSLINQLVSFINNRIIPLVPEHGAVGTSGDLVQLAHIALALIGKGEATYENQQLPVEVVMRKAKINPYKLRAKEGLALINGTSMMTGISSILIARAQKLLDIELRLGALTLELVSAFGDGISAELQSVRPHAGQIEVARILRSLLSDSKMLTSRDTLKHQENGQDVEEIPEDVQEVYSIRCMPQILGPVHDTIQRTKHVVETEMNSVSDNPVIDWKNGNFLHGGNFHGDYVAVSIDQMKASITKLTMLSERQINFFLNHRVNRHLPPFLNLKKPGLTLGLQGMQFVATSTTALNQSLAFPHNVHSIPTNADNQDVVSMGTDAALTTHRVIDNAFIVLAIESIVLAQAFDIKHAVSKFSKPAKTRFSSASQTFVSKVRKLFPTIYHDRDLTQQLPQIVELLKHDPFFTIVDRKNK